jgi:hypothetical protein
MLIENKKPRSVLFVALTVIFLIGALLVYFYWTGNGLTGLLLSIALAFVGWMFSLAAKKKD